MNIDGRTTVGLTPYEMVSDTLVVAWMATKVDALLSKVSIYLDGNGSGGLPGSTQAAKAVLYDANDNLVATSNEVVVIDNQPAGWADFIFSWPKGAPLDLAPAPFQLGLIAGGPTTNLIRVFGDDPHGGGGKISWDSYANGPAVTLFPSAILSGNEITDIQRGQALKWGVGQQGGQTDPQFFFGSPGGISSFPAATNLFRHGQCDGANGSAPADIVVTTTGVTPTIDTSTPAPFSPQSVKVVVDGSVASQGVFIDSPTGLGAAVGTDGIGGLWFKGTIATYNFQMIWVNTDATTTVVSSSSFTATGAWQWISPAMLATSFFTTVAAGKTGDKLRMRFIKTSQASNTFWIAHEVLQMGARVTNPYLATSGATASIGASRIQIPAMPLNTTQGWVCGRVNAFISNSQNPYNGGPTFATVFQWKDDANNLISLTKDYTSNGWTLSRLAAGAGASVTKSVGWGTTSGSVGAQFTFLIQWNATTLTIALGGSGFSTAANSNIPVLASQLIDLMSANGSGWFLGNLMWICGGKGQLILSDYTTLNATATLPALRSLPGQPTFAWNAFGGRPTVMQSSPLTADVSAFLTRFAPYSTVRPNETDLYYSRLPFKEAQDVFGLGAPLAGTARIVNVGWHHTFIDPEAGSNAIVRADGPYASLLGERILVTTVGTNNPRSVYAYVHAVSQSDELDWDLSLTRHLYGRLALLSSETTEMVVQVVS